MSPLRPSPIPAAGLTLNSRVYAAYAAATRDKLSLIAGLGLLQSEAFSLPPPPPPHLRERSGKTHTLIRQEVWVLCQNALFKSFSFSGLSVNNCKMGWLECITTSQTFSISTIFLIWAIAHGPSVCTIFTYLPNILL